MQTSSNLTKNNRSEIFWEFTRSLCPECKQVIDAQVLLRDNKVYLRKRCPQHGRFEALIFGDARLYTDIARFNKPGTLPLEFAADVRDGCPLDCGLCEDHQQHTCLALIEVNNLCDLDCPLCFAGAGSQHVRENSAFELSIEQVEHMLDAYIAAEGDPEVLQFSGGEPTLHPRILDFIALAQQKGIRYIMLNTNGLRIAQDDRFLEELARLKPHVYLQFDGFDPRSNLALRGREDLLEIKLQALDRLAKADVRVVLASTIERGINEHEVGRIVEFGLRHPAVFGINFQCAFHTSRFPTMNPLERLTVPDVVQGIESQTGGMFTLKDFIPVPCCMPVCNFVTYAIIQSDQAIPAPRLIPVDQYLDYLKNRSLPGLNDELLVVLERMWSSAAPVGSDTLTNDIRGILGETPPTADNRANERCPSCHAGLPISRHTHRDLGRHIFMISIRDFMDPWTFTVKNAMKCCVNILTIDGKLIPFCAYNSVGYRERIAAELYRGSHQPMNR